MDEHCSFCGEVHESRIETGSECFPVVYVCPRIPKDHLYFDVVYERGPRGALFPARTEESP